MDLNQILLHPRLSQVQPLISVKLLLIYTGDYGERQVCQVQQITQTWSLPSREVIALVTLAGALMCQSVHGTISFQASKRMFVWVSWEVQLTCKALCLFSVRIVKIDYCFKNESIQSNKPRWKLEVRAAVHKTDKEIHNVPGTAHSCLQDISIRTWRMEVMPCVSVCTYDK